MRKTFLVLMVALMGVVIAEPAAALDVDHIHIVQLKDHWGNVAFESPYGLEIWLTGTGITSVSVVDPHLVSHDLEFGDGEWEFDHLGFGSLTALNASYGPGDYVFNFNDGADTVTINYQYTEPTGFANITYPADGQTGVELDPVYTWNPVVGYGDALSMWVVESDTDIYSDGTVLDMSRTSWQAGALSGLTEYEFEISVANTQGTAPMQTVGNDAFNYYGLFESINMLAFTTKLPGDADGNSFVDDSDLAVLLGNWEDDPGTITTWELGDFTEDTDVDDDDLAVLLGNWTGPPPGAAAVPEPATMTLLGLGGLVAMRRRRRP